ncbi:succinate dehydrogenase assembly factor 2, partial [Paracoccaceae bacterium]|nr:succinate dehydrogenase assembly factor 2 [Paracoccaceae bacterium]
MNIDIVRKKLLIRSWRRGTKELDLILGRFSSNNVSKLEMAELDLFERLLSNDDHVIYGWL